MDVVEYLGGRALLEEAGLCGWALGFNSSGSFLVLSLCLLIIDAMPSVASYFFGQASPTMVDFIPSNCEPKQTLTPLSCFLPGDFFFFWSHLQEE